MGYVSMLFAAAHCCELALESAGEKGTRHSTPHPRPIYHRPDLRMRWLLSRVHEPEPDIGQGEGCEGVKCQVRR